LCLWFGWSADQKIAVSSAAATLDPALLLELSVANFADVDGPRLVDVGGVEVAVGIGDRHGVAFRLKGRGLRCVARWRI
jgi:hypothetical protein